MTTAEINTKIGRLFKMGDKAITKMNGDIDRRMVQLFKSSLKDVQHELAEMYRKYGDSVTLADMHKFKRLQSMNVQITSQLKDMGKQIKALTTDAIKMNLVESYQFTGYALEAPMAVDLGTFGLPVETIRAAVINPLDAIKWTDRLSTSISTLNRHVQEAVVQGLIQGHGYSKTAGMLKDKIGRSTYEARRIVWTESHRAKSMGRNLAFEESETAAQEIGVDIKHVWDATLDDRTRPEHQAMDGKVAEKQDDTYIWKFPDGTTTEGPSLSGVPEQDIHCRCSTRVEVDNMKPEFRRDNLEKKEIPFISYDEWQKQKGIKSARKAA